MIPICMCVGLWVGAVTAIVRHDGWPSDPFVWMMAAAALAISVGVGIGVAGVIGEWLPDEIDREPSHKAPIVALRSADGVRGDLAGGIFLTVWHVGAKLYYFWYEQYGEAITPRQELVGVGTYVYEEDRKDAEVKIYGWHFTHPWGKFLGFAPSGQTWEFHVPKGTVKRDIGL